MLGFFIEFFYSLFDLLWTDFCIFFNHVNTTIKLTNTNTHTNIIFMSIDYSEFFRLNIFSQYLSVNTDENIILTYIKRITMEKEKNEKNRVKKHDDVLFL
jgi:hypothetical protein